jgi:hypothetical protein
MFLQVTADTNTFHEGCCFLAPKGVGVREVARAKLRRQSNHGSEDGRELYNQEKGREC